MSTSGSAAWVKSSSSTAMRILEEAKNSRRPVVLLLGAGLSVDAGIPLASDLKEYLTQMLRLVRDEGFSNARQYVEETRWPSRHDLRIDLMLKEREHSLDEVMRVAERSATQAAMVSEIRSSAPMLAASLQEIFGQMDETVYNHKELRDLYGTLAPLAESLGRRSPRNIAYRSLLFHLCDRNQTTIDACLDHFMRDRQPTTPHQFVYFLTKLLNCRIILTTNFDQLLEMAFAGEGLLPRVYEVHGEGSIPSAQLLLSQPLSVVKLHGGAHQLQTGFDLDDPLSASALASFSELFRRLEGQDGIAPLIVALGYSGSDRRVMDIVANQIREWRPAAKNSDAERGTAGRAGGGAAYAPRVLWVNRDSWQPDLLVSAVNTHPDVLQLGDRANEPEHFPAHVVRYRDGRMFLLEAIQRLKKHFPIARSMYQAVNFVPHSVVGSDRGGTPFEKPGNWRIALIHSSNTGGGSSSQLVSLADSLERRDGYRTIWIDLTEVAGVSSLFDVISERVTKLDTRLQVIRRPPLLPSLLQKLDGAELQPYTERSQRHEKLTAVQWLRHALRRGRYLLAFDSLDEFPSSHPALADFQLGLADNGYQAKQRRLLIDVICNLIEWPNHIGDSRIAIALSTETSLNKDSKSGAANVGRADNEADYDRLVRAFDLEGRRTPEVVVWSDFTNNPSVPGNRDIKSRFNTFFEYQQGNDRDIVIKRNYYHVICGLIVLVSACARRIRSEVMLLRCTSELIGRLISPPSPDASPSVFAELLGTTFPGTYIIQTNPNPFDGVWRECAHYDDGHQLPCDKGFPQLDDDILFCIRYLAGESEPDARNEYLKCSSDKRAMQDWIYRTEGGYHWMHRDDRNGLYEEIRSKKTTVSMLATVHHVIALYSYDELYERSKDARSFLEYLFHRIASIRLAAQQPQNLSRYAIWFSV